MCLQIVKRSDCPDCGDSDRSTIDKICPSSARCPDRNKRPLEQREEFVSKLCPKCKRFDDRGSSQSYASGRASGRSRSRSDKQPSRVYTVDSDDTGASSRTNSRSSAYQSEYSNASTIRDYGRRSSATYTSGTRARDSSRYSEYSSGSARYSPSAYPSSSSFRPTADYRPNLFPRGFPVSSSAPASAPRSTSRSTYSGSTRTRTGTSQLTPLDNILRRHGLRSSDLMHTYEDEENEYEILKLPEELLEQMPPGELYQEGNVLYWKTFDH